MFSILSVGDDDEDFQTVENGTSSAKKGRRKSKTPAKTRKAAPSKYVCLLSISIFVV